MKTYSDGPNQPILFELESDVIRFEQWEKFVHLWSE